MKTLVYNTNDNKIMIVYCKYIIKIKTINAKHTNV